MKRPRDLTFDIKSTHPTQTGAGKNITTNCFPHYLCLYNEEKVIGNKIENTLALEYPTEKLEIIVFSDSSSDRTDEIVKNYEPRGVKLVRIEGRKGKVFCKNAVAKAAKGEILIFSDKNSMYEPDTVRQLVKHFADPNVG